MYVWFSDGFNIKKLKKTAKVFAVTSKSLFVYIDSFSEQRDSGAHLCVKKPCCKTQKTFSVYEKEK